MTNPDRIDDHPKFRPPGWLARRLQAAPDHPLLQSDTTSLALLIELAPDWQTQDPELAASLASIPTQSVRLPGMNPILRLNFAPELLPHLLHSPAVVSIQEDRRLNGPDPCPSSPAPESLSEPPSDPPSAGPDPGGSR